MSVIQGMEMTVRFFIFFLNQWCFCLNYCYSIEVYQGVIKRGSLWYFIEMAEVSSQKLAAVHKSGVIMYSSVQLHL